MNALRQIRERMRMTPSELARALDVSPDTIGNQERARKPRRIYLLAAMRVEDMRTGLLSASMDELRRTIAEIHAISERGIKL